MESVVEAHINLQEQRQNIQHQLPIRRKESSLLRGPFSSPPFLSSLFEVIMKGIFIASALVMATSAFSLHAPVAKNTVQDAFDQGSRLIRCWDPVDMTKPNGEYFLSEPIYELCSYMPFPGSFSKFYVNGVSQDSDDYSAIMSMFAANDHHYATLNVCLQEGFQFHAPGSPSQTSIRCLCKRDGCNIPKNFTTFLEFNQLPMPEGRF